MTRAGSAHLAYDVAERTGVPFDHALRLATASTDRERMAAEAMTGFTLAEALAYVPESASDSPGAWRESWGQRVVELLATPTTISTTDDKDDTP